MYAFRINICGWIFQNWLCSAQEIIAAHRAPSTRPLRTWWTHTAPSSVSSSSFPAVCTGAQFLCCRALKPLEDNLKESWWWARNHIWREQLIIVSKRITHQGKKTGRSRRLVRHQGKRWKASKKCIQWRGNPEARELAIVTMKEITGEEDTLQTQRMNMH